jgi:hypothetical protein
LADVVGQWQKIVVAERGKVSWQMLINYELPDDLLSCLWL